MGSNRLIWTLIQRKARNDEHWDNQSQFNAERNEIQVFCIPGPDSCLKLEGLATIKLVWSTDSKRKRKKEEKQTMKERATMRASQKRGKIGEVLFTLKCSLTERIKATKEAPNPMKEVRIS